MYIQFLLKQIQPYTFGSQEWNREPDRALQRHRRVHLLQYSKDMSSVSKHWLRGVNLCFHGSQIFCISCGVSILTP